tara:strand:+ start:5111 stop:5245 length:135 start_codon:yes stop_codon:yes gene_type:complete
MNQIKQIQKKISRENRSTLLKEPTKLLADFFNGVVIEIQEKTHD